MWAFVTGVSGVRSRSAAIVGERVCVARTAPRRRSLRVTPVAVDPKNPTDSKVPGEKDWKKLSSEEWRTILTPEQYRILRERGTERPGAGEYDQMYPQEGTFACMGCGAPLYKAETKFKSESGWPAFYDAIDGAVVEVKDGSRTEVRCTQCDGHLGHIFRGEGFKTPTDARHCVNSAALKLDGDS